MTLSTARQTVQAHVLVGMRRRMVQNSATSRYLAELFDLSTAQVAAALKLLETRGLVRRYTQGRTVRWNLTEAGRREEVK